jgi:methoxymalonate biosynthesis acyl carrier protein
MTDAIVRRLHALFVENLHIEVPSADTDLLDTGMLDSLQIVELLVQLEQRFGFRIRIDDIDLDDLRTLARIARLVSAQSVSADAPAPPSFRAPDEVTVDHPSGAPRTQNIQR